MKDLHLVEVGDDVSAPDALPAEAGRRAPDACRAKARCELVVDRIGDVLDGRSRLERKRLAVHTTAVPEIDADEPEEAPDRLAKPLEARVVENRHGHELEIADRG